MVSTPGPSWRRDTQFSSAHLGEAGPRGGGASCPRGTHTGLGPPKPSPLWNVISGSHAPGPSSACRSPLARSPPPAPGSQPSLNTSASAQHSIPRLARLPVSRPTQTPRGGNADLSRIGTGVPDLPLPSWGPTPPSLSVPPAPREMKKTGTLSPLLAFWLIPDLLPLSLCLRGAPPPESFRLLVRPTLISWLAMCTGTAPRWPPARLLSPPSAGQVTAAALWRETAEAWAARA